MKIHEVLDRDPRTARLANNGQARIVDVADGAAREELRAELRDLSSADGQFGDALQRILDRYPSRTSGPPSRTRPGSAASSAAASRTC